MEERASTVSLGDNTLQRVKEEVAASKEEGGSVLREEQNVIVPPFFENSVSAAARFAADGGVGSTNVRCSCPE